VPLTKRLRSASRRIRRFGKGSPTSDAYRSAFVFFGLAGYRPRVPRVGSLGFAARSGRTGKGARSQRRAIRRIRPRETLTSPTMDINERLVTRWLRILGVGPRRSVGKGSRTVPVKGLGSRGLLSSKTVSVLGLPIVHPVGEREIYRKILWPLASSKANWKQGPLTDCKY